MIFFFVKLTLKLPFFLQDTTFFRQLKKLSVTCATLEIALSVWLVVMLVTLYRQSTLIIK